MLATKLNSLFKTKLKELNEERAKEGKDKIGKFQAAQVIFSDENSTESSKSQRLSNCLSGKMEFKANQLRRMRKLFTCTIDEFYPMSEDISMDCNI